MSEAAYSDDGTLIDNSLYVSRKGPVYEMFIEQGFNDADNSIYRESYLKLSEFTSEQKNSIGENNANQRKFFSKERSTSDFTRELYSNSQ